MASHPTTTNNSGELPQDQPQDTNNTTTTTLTTTPTNLETLKSQPELQTATIASLESRLRTQTALGELYFQWGQDSDKLLRQMTKLLKAKGREVRRLKAEVLRGQVERAKMKVVAEVLAKLCEHEVSELEGKMEEDRSDEGGGQAEGDDGAEGQ